MTQSTWNSSRFTSILLSAFELSIKHLAENADIYKKERNAALKWYRVHDELNNILGTPPDCSPDYTLGLWKKAIYDLSRNSILEQ